MIWLTWRLQRFELGLIAGLLTLLSVYLLVTGMGIHTVYRQLSRACASAGGSGQPCDQLTRAIFDWSIPYTGLTAWLQLIPLGIAILAAAPLLLQLEHGTYRLVWTQSATRERWLAAMLGSALLVTAVASTGFDLLASWWKQPVDAVQGSLLPGSFELEGVVPIAYGIFALALVVSTGVVLRRSMAAIGATFAGFLVVRFAITTWLRPDYLAPIRYSFRIGAPTYTQIVRTGDWEIATGISDGRGQIYSVDTVSRICPLKVDPHSGRQILDACLRRHDFIYNTALYQPASRFWPFQFIESAIYVGMAGVLLGVSVWWIRSRLA